jgi:hypothetical protein
VNPPAKEIRLELADALAAGIRQRGPEAAGLVLVGGARLILGLATLLAFRACGGSAFGEMPLWVSSLFSVTLAVLATLQIPLPQRGLRRERTLDSGRRG